MEGDELDSKDRPTIRHLRIDWHEVRTDVFKEQWYRNIVEVG